METKPGDLEGLVQSTTKVIEKDGVDTNLKPDALSTHMRTEVPDPDEDDLDDLDDMLDEFTPSKPSTSPPKSQIPAVENGLSDEDFAKQLQAGMSELLGELDTNPDMAAQFEAMMKELGDSNLDGETLAPFASSTTAKEVPTPTTTKAQFSTAPGSASEESFQETIKKTMQRMQASGDSATAAATSSSGPTDLMEEMMKAMQEGGLGGEGGDSEEDFSKMLLGMMEQLTNKDILYEPMKELDDKFPGWMKENEGKVKEADWKRYVEQQGFVKEIVKRFERKGYSDDKAEDREYIVERMQKMQAVGSPPPDLVGDMDAAQQVFGNPDETLDEGKLEGKLEEQCTQQ